MNGDSEVVAIVERHTGVACTASIMSAVEAAVSAYHVMEHAAAHSQYEGRHDHRSRDSREYWYQAVWKVDRLTCIDAYRMVRDVCEIRPDVSTFNYDVHLDEPVVDPLPAHIATLISNNRTPEFINALVAAARAEAMVSELKGRRALNPDHYEPRAADRRATFRTLASVAGITLLDARILVERFTKDNPLN